MTDTIELLEFVYARMKNVHGENAGLDYMINFKQYIDVVKKTMGSMRLDEVWKAHVKWLEEKIDYEQDIGKRHVDMIAQLEKELERKHERKYAAKDLLPGICRNDDLLGTISMIEEGSGEFPEIRDLKTNPISWDAVFMEVKGDDAMKQVMRAKAVIEWLCSCLVSRRAGWKTNTENLILSLRKTKETLATTELKLRVAILEGEKSKVDSNKEIARLKRWIDRTPYAFKYEQEPGTKEPEDERVLNEKKPAPIDICANPACGHDVAAHASFDLNTDELVECHERGCKCEQFVKKDG